MPPFLFRIAIFCARIPFVLIWLPIKRIRDRATWPTSVEVAVQRLLTTLDERNLARARTCPEEDFVLLYFALGQKVRNAFGLWEGNKDLLRSCGSENTHPDVASGVIIYALWQRLRGEDAAGGRPGQAAAHDKGAP